MAVLRIRIRCFFDPRIRDPGWVKNNNPDHISENLETIFWDKILQFFDADPGFGMEIIRIQDPRWKNSDPGTGINIPDPQHCLECEKILCRDMIAGHHVISIEEDGQITIQKLEEEEEEEDWEEGEVEVSPAFPPWYHRLATMLLGFLKTGSCQSELCYLLSILRPCFRVDDITFYEFSGSVIKFTYPRIRIRSVTVPIRNTAWCNNLEANLCEKDCSRFGR